MIRIFLSHASADLALTEGALKLLSGPRSEPLFRPLRSRIELPNDVDSFAQRISTLQNDFFVFVLFSKNWKITNAVRLARRLSDVRPRSAVLCEREWGADPGNLEPFSGFDLQLIDFKPTQISERIENHLQRLHSDRRLAEGARLFDFSRRTPKIDDCIFDDPDDCEGKPSPLESEDIIASVGAEASDLPSIEDLMTATGQTRWDPEIDPADDIDVDPGVIAAMRRLAEKGYGLEDEDLDFVSGGATRAGASSGQAGSGQTALGQTTLGQATLGKSGSNKSGQARPDKP